MQNEARGINVDEYHEKVLGLADDLDILGDSLDYTMRATEALEHAAERIVGLHVIDADKTKLMELLLLDVETSLDALETLPYYEKVEQFRYLLNTNNYWSREIGTRITKAERAFFISLKFSYA